MLWDQYKNVLSENLDLTEVYEKTHTKGEVHLVSKLLTGKYIHKSRVTDVYTDTSFIYNNIIYPKTGKNLPCLGIDLMGFYQKKVIIVFDFQHPKEHYDFNPPIVQELMGDYLDNTGEIRFFEKGNHFSRYIFVRKCHMDEVNNYLTDFEKYVKVYSLMLEEAKPTEEDTSEFVAFDTYMHKLDPVSPFMESKFGKEFAKDYVDNFLFPYFLPE